MLSSSSLASYPVPCVPASSSDQVVLPEEPPEPPDLPDLPESGFLGSSPAVSRSSSKSGENSNRAKRINVGKGGSFAPQSLLSPSRRSSGLQRPRSQSISGYVSPADLEQRQEELISALQRSVNSNSSGAMSLAKAPSRGHSPSPRNSVASINAQSLKEFRKGYHNSGESLFTRPAPLCRSASPTANPGGSRRSVIQVMSPPPLDEERAVSSSSGTPSPKLSVLGGVSGELGEASPRQSVCYRRGSGGEGPPPPTNRRSSISIGEASARSSGWPSVIAQGLSFCSHSFAPSASLAPSCNSSLGSDIARAPSGVSSHGSMAPVSVVTSSTTSKSCKSQFSECFRHREQRGHRPDLRKSLSLTQERVPREDHSGRLHNPLPDCTEAVTSRRGSSISEWADRRSEDCSQGESILAQKSVRLSLSRLEAFYSVKRKAAPYCRSVSKNRPFQVTMFGALLCALFLPDLWILLDRPNNDDLDGILSFVLLLFLVELVVQSVGLTRTYWGSFFFWMDLLGAFSLLLDMSYVGIATSSVGESGSNVVFLRAARVAKLGARAGRFTRLAKLLRFLPGMKVPNETDQGTAKVISARLITSLSMRVSCLIILMVILMPLFSMWTYPVQDWSMKSWLNILEVAASQHPESFQEQLLRFGAFYADKGYYPYRLTARDGAVLSAEVLAALPWEFPRGPPLRKANSVRHEGASLSCDFNFKKPHQNDSLMNILLLIVVTFLMVGFSLMLSNFVSARVLQPLEKLLTQVRKMASTIFQSVTDMTVTLVPTTGETAEDGQDAGDACLGNETELLERVVAKLAILSNIAMSKTTVDTELIESLGEGDRAVIRGFQGQWALSRVDSIRSDADEDVDQEEMRSVQKLMVENAGLSLALINSDCLNPLELDRARNQAAATYFVSQLHHNMPFDACVMRQFLEAVQEAYVKSLPYHNWYHAVDVTHCVYRLLHSCVAEQYLNCSERFGLLISAICHDIGHPGLNNVYLVETAHDLALRYNDKSPLENMHCARLFELVSNPNRNIFACLLKHQFQEVRKVCVEAILHTDNAQHFVMIKEIQMFYEVNSELLDALHDSNLETEHFTPTKEAVELFRQPESQKLLVKVFLHFADISNPMKPFRICRIWAMQIMEELFMQGDMEKKMGVPVQALNDRDRVNKAFSQIGFIEFLVSPLVFVVTKVMMPLEPYAENMMTNIKLWHQCWLAETQPEPSEADQKAAADRIVKLNQRFLGLQS